MIRSYEKRTKLLKFTKELGYDNAPFHIEWYNYLQDTFSPLKAYPNAQKKYLLLWPRGHGKTTSIILYILWLIGNQNNIHINIISKTATLAESILTAIMTYIETSDVYHDIFPSVQPSRRKWTNQQLIIQRDEISKNPTLKATGLMGPITGGRNDLIVCDDIIDEENVRTRLQVEKVSTWFNKVLYPTMYPWGGIIVIGTRWSYADIYAELLLKWPYDIKPAIQTDNGKVTGVLWPEYWSLKKLEERRKEIGSIIFDCQYQNDPTGMEGSLLKAEWLHEWQQPPPTNIITYAGVDPALGEGDKQSIATLSQVPNGQTYLVDVWADTVPIPQFYMKLKQLHALHRYSKIYMESNAFQKVLLYSKELEGMPIVGSQTVRDKEQRFIGMSAHFESKRVLVNPLLRRNSEFWTEWVQFPRGQFDDALDSVEIVSREVVGKPRGRIII